MLDSFKKNETYLFHFLAFLSTFVRLSHCGVTADGYAAVATALKSNPTHLEELNLRGNDPGDTGVRPLIHFLHEPDCKLKRLR